MSATALLVGLTGNIAAGKSTISGWLGELGCHVIDLDALNRECMEPGAPAHSAVVATFGESILDAEGGIDRRALGDIVFGDDDARARLEAIMHPAIRSLQQRRVEEIVAREGTSIVLLEAALFYETGGWEQCDRMIVVTAPDELRLPRLMERGFSETEARERMASQMDQYEKARRADYVIDNTGSFEDARADTEAIAGKLRHDLVCHAAGKPLEPVSAS